MISNLPCTGIHPPLILLKEGTNLLFFCKGNATEARQQLAAKRPKAVPHHDRYDAQYDLGVWNGHALDVFQSLEGIFPAACGVNYSRARVQSFGKYVQQQGDAYKKL